MGLPSSVNHRAKSAQSKIVDHSAPGWRICGPRGRIFSLPEKTPGFLLIYRGVQAFVIEADAVNGGNGGLDHGVRAMRACPATAKTKMRRRLGTRRRIREDGVPGLNRRRKNIRCRKLVRRGWGQESSSGVEFSVKARRWERACRRAIPGRSGHRVAEGIGPALRSRRLQQPSQDGASVPFQ